MNVRPVNSEVLYAEDSVVRVSRCDMEGLKKQISRATRQRLRLCTHKSLSDSLHEMFIIHTKETYVRPHKHHGKAESLHVLEGRADVILFDETGRVEEVFPVSGYRSNNAFYYRLPDGVYHTLLIRSDLFIFHESTTGPFDPSRTEFPAWAPEGNRPREVARYLKTLDKGIRVQFNSHRRDS